MAQKSESFWQRYFDGWQAGLVLLWIAGSATLLAMPRAVVPTHLPPPAIDHEALQRAAADDDLRARQALLSELDPSVRLVGRALRNYNLATMGSDGRELASARRRLAHAVTRALPQGSEPLLQLRAYQLTQFVTLAQSWRCGEAPGDALIELAGDFMAAAVRNEWCAQDGSLLADERVLRVLFKRRWNEISGLKQGAFELALDEDRVRYDFLVRHPFVTDKLTALSGRQGLERARDKARMQAIDRLAERDPSYPTQLARGIILFRQGQYALAASAFRQHLAERPDGPYTLYARNHLKAALDGARGGL